MKPGIPLFLLFFFLAIDGKLPPPIQTNSLSSRLDLCFQECSSALTASLTAESICTTFEKTDTLEAAQMLQRCRLGFSIGTEIGCLHRCQTSRSEWTLDAMALQRAQVAACGPRQEQEQELAKRQHVYPDCHYGFEAVLKNIFRLWTSRPLPEMISPRYLIYPVLLPSQSLVYVYWNERADETDDNPDTPAAKATRFCVHLQLEDPDIELECGRQLIQGLAEREQAQDWRSDYPRILLLIPITLDKQEMRLVMYEGQTAVVTALDFCAQLDLPSIAHQDNCVEGILPILQQELEQATGY